MSEERCPTNPNNDHSERFKVGLYEARQVRATLWNGDDTVCAGVNIHKELRRDVLFGAKRTWYVVFAVYNCCCWNRTIPGTGGRVHEWTEDYEEARRIADIEAAWLKDHGWNETGHR